MENLEFLFETFEKVCSRYGIDSQYLIIDENTFEISPDPSCIIYDKNNNEIKFEGTLYFMKISDLKLLENEIKKRLKAAV